MLTTLVLTWARGHTSFRQICKVALRQHWEGRKVKQIPNWLGVKALQKSVIFRHRVDLPPGQTTVNLSSGKPKIVVQASKVDQSQGQFLNYVDSHTQVVDISLAPTTARWARFQAWEPFNKVYATSLLPWGPNLGWQVVFSWPVMVAHEVGALDY